MFKKTAVEDYLQLHFYALTAPKKLVACFSSACWAPHFFDFGPHSVLK